MNRELIQRVKAEPATKEVITVVGSVKTMFDNHVYIDCGEEQPIGFVELHFTQPKGNEKAKAVHSHYVELQIRVVDCERIENQ